MRHAILLALTLVGAPKPAAAGLDYPAARSEDFTYQLHGQTIADPYRWLEDGGSDEVKRWVAAQDDLARSTLAKLPERDAIAARLKELLYVEEVEVPRKRGGRLFFARRDKGSEKAIVYWKEGSDGAERPLLDPNAWSAHGNVSLGRWEPSWDGRKVAYCTKSSNSDEATLQVIDVDSGKVSDVIDGAKYAWPSWMPQGEGFYYVRLPTDPSIPAAERPGRAELRFHRLGEDTSGDAVACPATGDPSVFLSGGVSRDGRFLVITHWHGWSRSDVHFRELLSPESQLVPLATGQDALYDVQAHEGRLYVLTNEGAPRWRVLRVDPARPGRDQWTEIVPERADATLSAMTIVGGRLSLAYLKNVVTHVEIHDLDGKLVRELKLPPLGSASQIEGDPLDDAAYFSFTSFTRPAEIRQVSVRTGRQVTWHRLSVPVDASRLVAEQVFFASKDGTRVPMFVVRARATRLDGKAPCILYGYGGFQSAQVPMFVAGMVPWLERGGVLAVANLRGGNEYGEEWHRAGMRLRKQNVFDDFIAAAEHLITRRYTSRERLVIKGESNGGLLVGAALTQRPDLFRAALCGVPLLDMVRYPLFGSGATWVDEYGSPDEPEELRALLAYSPYHHVASGTRYPSVLVLSADSDDRVDPMHARKFAALLQAASTGGPVLLRVERESGHEGADQVGAFVNELADELAFALAETR